jgi:ribonuclease BN (tRNA processing enzyme)
VGLQVGDLRLRFFRGRHYVPAWGVVVEAPDGTRLAYTGDTGPSSSVEDAVRDADLLLVETALRSAADDDPERGHLTGDEAIALARSAEVRSALLVHFNPDRVAELAAACAVAGPWVRPAVDGLTVTVSPAQRGTGVNGSPDPDAVADAASEPSPA